MARSSGEGRPPAARPRPVRAVLVALASLTALVLLACGVVEVLPRPVGAPSASVAAGASAGTSGKAPASALALRGAGLAAAPAPTGPGDGLAAATAPLLTLPAVSELRVRPPTSRPPAGPAGPAGSRAPPLSAGT